MIRTLKSAPVNRDFPVRDPHFYRTFIRLCTALMLEQAVVLSVNLADNLMLGTYSEAALSGVAAVNQIQFVYQQLVYSIGNALITLASQYWGQKRLREVRKICVYGVMFEALSSLIFFSGAAFFPRQMVGIFTSSSVFIGEGTSYLAIMKFSYPVFALTAILLSSLRVVEKVGIALKVSVVSLLINVSINFLLIKGHFGFPALGARGAAIGTLTARVVEFAIVAAFVLKDTRLGLRLSDFRREIFREGLFRDYVRVFVPVVGASMLWGLSNAVQTVILGHMNDSAIAAQSISNTVFLLLKVTAVGAASASAVLIGRTVGEGDMKKLKSYTKTLQLIYIGIGVILALIMVLIRYPILSIYSGEISAETYSLANIYMLIQAVVLFFMSYQMPINAGIIRGGGDVKYVFFLDLTVLFGFMPFAAVAAFVWHWPPAAVIFCLNVDQILKVIPAYIHVNSYRWVRHLTQRSS